VLRRASLIFLLLLSLLLLIGGEGRGCGKRERLKIGLLLYRESEPAVDYFVKTLKGKPVELFVGREEGDISRGRAIVEKFADEGVDLLVWASTSTSLVNSLDLLKNFKFVVDLSATTTVISHRRDNIVRLVLDLAEEQRMVAREILRMSKRVFVVGDTSNPSYTEPAFSYFKEEFLKRGGVRVYEVWFDFSKGDFSVLSEALRDMQGKYEAVYVLGGYTYFLGMVYQKVREVTDVPIFFTPWARSESLVETVGADLKELYLLSFYPAKGYSREADYLLEECRLNYGVELDEHTYLLYEFGRLLSSALSSGLSVDSLPHYFSDTSYIAFGREVRLDEYGDCHRNYFLVKLTKEGFVSVEEVRLEEEDETP